MTEDQRIQKMIDYSDNIIQPMIVNEFETISSYMGCVSNKMVMKREKTCSVGLWGDVKKRYCLLVHDNENIRYKEPKLVVTGFEVKRSSTPKIVKPFIEQIYIKLMKKESVEDMKKFMKESREEYQKKDVYEIAFPRSINGLNKYCVNGNYIKKTPIAVKGSIIYNRFLELTNQSHIYPPIVGGNKIKFVYLTKNNPLNETVIAFNDKFPEELKEYIDYDLMFEKSLFVVVERIANTLGITLRDNVKTSLEDLL